MLCLTNGLIITQEQQQLWYKQHLQNLQKLKQERAKLSQKDGEGPFPPPMGQLVLPPPPLDAPKNTPPPPPPKEEPPAPPPPPDEVSMPKKQGCVSNN